MDTLDDIRPDLENYLGARRTLVDTMTRQFRAGVPAMQVWRRVSSAFSRDQVKEYLAAVALCDGARTALTEAGLASCTAVSVTGIDAPREAHLAIAADPEEVPDFLTLPERIRGALRDFHITLDLPQRAEHDEITPGLVDGFLLGGEPVRLVRLKPRT
jgi:hypothetical protein